MFEINIVAFKFHNLITKPQISLEKPLNLTGN